MDVGGFRPAFEFFVNIAHVFRNRSIGRPELGGLHFCPVKIKQFVDHVRQFACIMLYDIYIFVCANVLVFSNLIDSVAYQGQRGPELMRNIREESHFHLHHFLFLSFLFFLHGNRILHLSPLDEVTETYVEQSQNGENI